MPVPDWISDYLCCIQVELIFHTGFLSVSIQFGADLRDRIGVTQSLLFPEGGSFQGSPIHFFFLLFSWLLHSSSIEKSCDRALFSAAGFHVCLFSA